MSPEALQTFGVMAIALGFMLVGLGGFTAYHASQKLQHSAEIRALEQKGDMNAQILTLLLKNQELQGKLGETGSGTTVNPPGEPPPASVYRPPAPPPPTFSPAPPVEPEEHQHGHQHHPAVEPPPPSAPSVSLGATPPVSVEEAAAEATSSPSEPELPSRHLSSRQQRLISDTLRAHGKHIVTIESSFGDATSHEFAEELAEAFSKADWIVRGIDPHRGLPLSSGVTVSAGSFPPQPETRAVYEALLSAGIAVTQQLDPKQRSGETVLLVGSPL